jgi:hypothetical protein
VPANTMGAAFSDSVSRHTRMALGLLRSIAEHPPLAPIPCYLGATLAGFQLAGFAKCWSGCRESNPRHQLGRLCTTPENSKGGDIFSAQKRLEKI